MGQKKGNPTPSYQNEAYEVLRPNTGARENRDMGTKPVMINDTTTLQQTVITALATSGDQSITGSLFIKDSVSIVPHTYYRGPNGYDTTTIITNRNLSIETYGWNNGNDSGYHGYTMNSGSFYVNSGSLVVKGPESLIVVPNHSNPPTSSLTRPWGFGVPNQPPSGALYFNTTNSNFYGWNGAQWKQLNN
jgi:hypothetical protein